MLKIILGYVLIMFIFGLWFGFILNISENKFWRVVNAVWGFGIPVVILCYPIVNAFSVSFSLGFKYILVTSIFFTGSLAFMKIIHRLLEKGIVMLEKLDKKNEVCLKNDTDKRVYSDN